MPFDLSDVVNDPDLAESFTIMRSTATRFDDGDATPNSSTEIPAIGSVQSTPGNMLEMLPEGDRDRQSIVIYTATQLLLGADDGSGTIQLKDQIVWKGTAYSLVRAQDWSSYGYYFGMAVTEN